LNVGEDFFFFFYPERHAQIVYIDFNLRTFRVKKRIFQITMKMEGAAKEKNPKMEKNI
jgi:hypothetical protein